MTHDPETKAMLQLDLSSHPYTFATFYYRDISMYGRIFSAF